VDDDREITLIIEIKGYEKEQDRAKYTAAEKWVCAVNHHGGFGTWAFFVCKDPNQFGKMLNALKLPMIA
jgi:type III restriction enzyme